MTHFIRPETGSTYWAIFSQADQLEGSKGKKKLRADLTLLYGNKRMREMDKTHHLAIAVEDPKIREHKAGDPLKAGFRRVAVKIEIKEEGDNNTVDKYVILNINSLAKRLGVSKEEIKEYEKQGTVDELIKKRLGDIDQGQQFVSETLSNIREAIKGGKPFEFDDDETEKEDFLRFIKNHFNDAKLYQAAQSFVGLEFKPENKGVAETFLQQLEPKIWWDSKCYQTVHEKVALTPGNLGGPEAFTCGIFYGQPFERPGYPVKEARYIHFISWEKSERKYAIRVGDYLYSSKPTSYAKNEVPVNLVHLSVKGSTKDKKGEKWILMNINDLKKFGLTRKQIKEGAENGTLEELISERARTINGFEFPVKITKDNVNGWNASRFKEALKHIEENHLDIEAKEVAKLVREDFINFENQSVEDGKKSSSISQRIIQDSHKLGQKLAAIGLFSDGHIRDTFVGKALVRGKATGKFANRWKTIEWDKKRRYAPQMRAETYFSKPTDLASNEVALKRFRWSESKKGELRTGEWFWHVYNKNSLKRRLAISEEELNGFEDHRLIFEKLDAIRNFNENFENDFDDPELTVEKYQNRLNVAMRLHPDGEVRKVLEEAERHLSKLEKRWKKPEVAFPEKEVLCRLPDEVELLRNKLIKIGALSENRKPRASLRSKYLFDGIVLTEKTLETMNKIFKETNIECSVCYEDGQPQLSFVKGDVSHSHAISFDGRIYPRKPIPRSKMEVTMVLADNKGNGKGWVLVDIRSLERLGLSSKEAKKAEKYNNLNELVLSTAQWISESNATKAKLLGVSEVFHGRACPTKEHKGLKRHRIRWSDWDVGNRYAIVYDGIRYLEKPIPRSDREVPCFLHSDNPQRKSCYVLLNVHSLGRLGISPNEARSFGEGGQLPAIIKGKMDTIHVFNKEKFFEKIQCDASNALKFFNSYGGNRYGFSHPDPEVRKVLLKAARKASKMEPDADASLLVKEVKLALEKMGLVLGEISK